MDVTHYLYVKNNICSYMSTKSGPKTISDTIFTKSPWIVWQISCPHALTGVLQALFNFLYI